MYNRDQSWSSDTGAMSIELLSLFVAYNRVESEECQEENIIIIIVYFSYSAPSK